MDNLYLKRKIKEVNKLSEVMLLNIDNTNLIKFFAGQLSVLSKEITAIILKTN